jgi:hypothetical protein
LPPNDNIENDGLKKYDPQIGQIRQILREESSRKDARKRQGAKKKRKNPGSSYLFCALTP